MGFDSFLQLALPLDELPPIVRHSRNKKLCCKNPHWESHYGEMMIHLHGSLFGALFLSLCSVCSMVCGHTANFRGPTLADVKPPTQLREQGKSYLETWHRSIRHNTDQAQPSPLWPCRVLHSTILSISVKRHTHCANVDSVNFPSSRFSCPLSL